MPTFVIPADHPSLPGHFPGRPLVPGVILLERVVEAAEAAHLALGLGPLSAPIRFPQVKFAQPLLPGETAQIELEQAGAGPRWRFRVLRGTTVLASGELVAHAGSGDSEGHGE